MRKLKTAAVLTGAVAFLVASSVTQAALVTLNFSGTGLAHFGDFNGVDVDVMGYITYDSTLSPSESVAFGFGATSSYHQPVVSASFTALGGIETIADMTTINNGDPFLFASSIQTSTTCLGTVSLCPDGTPTTNAAHVGDETESTYIDSNGQVQYSSRDSLSFVLGGPGSGLPFTPFLTLTTATETIPLFLAGVGAFIYGLDGANLWDGTALPNSADFFAPELIEAAHLNLLYWIPSYSTWLFVDTLNSLALSVSAENGSGNGGGSVGAVPEPATLLLVFLAVILFAIQRRHSQYVRRTGQRSAMPASVA